ncbi:hypothetical protein HN51_057965 [Arachis hypogaea]|uniref:Uncharacterized protein n=2 Tax=Arachis hypogaea TaxID=3818 RepID=A0A444WYU5_ARAHY|nr:uncharacterized protein At4g38062-like isoform X1 [Arachis ipaensis]QHN81101.1 uncharacterized protein DS421_20g684000 [Arachis hypogaea]RYQ82626.1 hypothetical protein Ahy_B10g101207 [Arachis hypogaea]
MFNCIREDKKMDGVQRELEEAKEQVGKLKEECRIKTQLVESLKKDCFEASRKLQEAKQQGEKQASRLVLNSEEIFELKKIQEDLKSSLREKETHIMYLSAENKKIQADCNERMVQLEENNRKLVLDLDEVNARNTFLEHNACASSKEISGLKTLLSATEKKCLEAEEKAREAKILRRRDDVILQLEEENISTHDKIKWRNEQFKHLEEAHEQLRVQFQSSREEWEKERALLLDQLSSLQISLDSQTRIAEGLQSRLEMCNHALAREESKRKLLEAEISEFKSHFENVFTQCEEKKSEIQQLNILRNEEIVQLRSSLGDKEMLVREMEHKIVRLEQDNKELGELLKELREAQIHNAGANSLVSKLRNKLKKLEEVHKNCSLMLKSKESEWSCQAEKMEADISTFKSTLNTKEQEIRELQTELEKCFCAIEEKHMELLIFKSQLAEADSKSFLTETDKAVCISENEDLLCLSTEHMRLKDDSQKAMARECLVLEEELERLKKMLDESSEGQLVLKEQLLQVENTLKYEKGVAFEALEMLKLEVANKNDEISRLDCELQNWKSTAEALDISFKEIQATCEKMEASLLSQAENEELLKHENGNLIRIVKDQERKTEDLQQQIALLEKQYAEITEEAERCKQEKKELVQISEERDCCINNLQKDIAFACLKQESLRKEIEDAIVAQLAAENALEQEKKILLNIIAKKDQTINHFQELASAMEQDLLSAACLAFLEQVENSVEVSVLHEALKEAESLAKQEIEEKNMKIVKSELEMTNLLENSVRTEQSFLCLKQDSKQLQASLEVMKLETERLSDKQHSMEGIITKLKFERENLLQEIMKLTTERDSMLLYIEDVCDRIGEMSSEDMHLMEKLGNILSTSIDENETGMDSVLCDKLHDSDKANGFHFPLRTKRVEENLDGRSPLREVNSWHV